ncbi:hypothetical protein [Flavobacterium sp.]|uniref:hypothetical protein n=1 Tax=Flavobacterium sp. TaxID=239 RepID=UPI0040342FBE
MFEDLIEQFDELESEKNYWFIRTSKGKNYHPFRTKGFIGINWNYVTLNDWKTKTPTQIRLKISQNERNSNNQLYDPNSTEGKRKITEVYNKIKRFSELKEGDLIIIPSSGSQYLTFGYVADNEIYEEYNDQDCDFHKRRKVNWIITKELSELDTIFYKIIYSKHAVSNLNIYSDYIDKVIKNIFVKNDRSHLVVEVYSTDDINYDALNGVMSGVRKLTEDINAAFNLGENLTDNSIKLNLQSPGNIEFIYNNKGRSILLGAILLAIPLATACSHGELKSVATHQEVQAEIDYNKHLLANNIDENDTLTHDQKVALTEFAEIDYDTIVETKYYLNKIKGVVKSQNE